MVRTYILTERERQIIKRYLETGEKLDGFSALLHYLRTSTEARKADAELIERFLAKASQKI
jgi:histidinol phosphatase-like enzyme